MKQHLFKMFEGTVVFWLNQLVRNDGLRHEKLKGVMIIYNDPLTGGPKRECNRCHTLCTAKTILSFDNIGFVITVSIYFRTILPEAVLVFPLIAWWNLNFGAK